MIALPQRSPVKGDPAAGWRCSISSLCPPSDAPLFLCSSFPRPIFSPRSVRPPPPFTPPISPHLLLPASPRAPSPFIMRLPLTAAARPQVEAFVPHGPLRLLSGGTTAVGGGAAAAAAAVRRRCRPRPRPAAATRSRRGRVSTTAPTALADPSPRRSGDGDPLPSAAPGSATSPSTAVSSSAADNGTADRRPAAADDRPAVSADGDAAAGASEPAALQAASTARAGPSEEASDDSVASVTSPATSSKNDGMVSVSVGFGNVQVSGKLLLFTVAALWGSFSPFVRLLFLQEHAPPPALFNTERLLVSTAVYLPILYGEFLTYRADKKGALEDLASSTEASPSGRDEPTASEKAGVIKEVKQSRLDFLWAGLELGGFVFLANVSQVLGLEQTSASRAAFLNQLQTVVVPILAGALGLQAISNRTWASSAIAVSGVALLSLDKSHGSVSSLTGDALEVVSAIFFSAYILRLGKYAQKVRAPPLVATKIVVQALLSICWVTASSLLSTSHHVTANYAPGGRMVPAGGVLGTGWTAADVAVNVGVVIWTGLFVSALSGYIQTKGQSAVKPSDAAVIFATQPLFAAALSALVLGEGFGPKGIAGGVLILGATILSSLGEEEASPASSASSEARGAVDAAAAEPDKKDR